ncbi:MAG TPA: hypothetical protein VK530_01730 [Candidatus Acidoferrum sp.]|nr:hypothetical protein [Candidatus Acidoferrum sp.]
MNVTAPICSLTTCGGTPAVCRTGCALEVIDELLRAHGTVRGDEVDGLLDLRWFLNHRADAEAALALFCTLRRAMEGRHYLAFFRLRRWLENHISVTARLCPGLPARTVSLALNNFCLEAIRSRCVLAARRPGEPLFGARVTFAFAPLAPVIREVTTSLALA